MPNYLEIFGDIAWVATIVGAIAALHSYCNNFWVKLPITLLGVITIFCYLGFRYKDFFCSLRRKKMIPCEILEEPEGQVPLDSKFYVKRPGVESECYKTILKPNALICIKAPQQMGKTSLMTRILHHA